MSDQGNLEQTSKKGLVRSQDLLLAQARLPEPDAAGIEMDEVGLGIVADPAPPQSQSAAA